MNADAIVPAVRNPASPPERPYAEPLGNHAPKLSIVTPSYNQGQYIEATIRSILAQDCRDYEHIIIDGGSTDGTREIVAKYEGLYPMRWLSEPDRGQADAIAKGFGLCRGAVVAWLNSDDVYLGTQVLSRVLQLFEHYPEIHAVSAGGVELSPSGQWGRQIPVRQDYYTHQRLCMTDHVLQPATFFRREVLTWVPLDTSLHYAFDWDFFIRLAKSFNLLPIDEVWAGYRISGTNKTETGGWRRCDELRMVIHRYTGRLSIQYLVISTYCLLLRLSEWLPERARSKLSRGVRKLSQVIQVASCYRTTSI